MLSWLLGRLSHDKALQTACAARSINTFTDRPTICCTNHAILVRVVLGLLVEKVSISCHRWTARRCMSTEILSTSSWDSTATVGICDVACYDERTDARDLLISHPMVDTPPVRRPAIHSPRSLLGLRVRPLIVTRNIANSDCSS